MIGITSNIIALKDSQFKISIIIIISIFEERVCI